jgi:Polyketide cyclase / dehydrase and lipid transport.
MGLIRNTTLLPAPLETAFELLHPSRLHEYVVGMTEPATFTGDGGPGTSGSFRLRLLGLTQSYRFEVAAYAMDGEGAVWQGLLRAPLFDIHESWRLVPYAGGTTATWEMEYRVKGGPLGRLAEALVLRRVGERFATQTLESMRRLCTTASQH